MLNNEMNFKNPDMIDVESIYSTSFGFSFSMNTKVYGKLSAHNTNLMIRRHTSRKLYSDDDRHVLSPLVDERDLDSRLKQNQEDFHRIHSLALRDAIEDSIGAHDSKINTTIEAALLTLEDVTHEKWSIRVKAYEQTIDKGQDGRILFVGNHQSSSDTLVCNQKLNEKAKPDGYPRAIFDCTTPNSLRVSQAVSYKDHCADRVIYFAGDISLCYAKSVDTETMSTNVIRFFDSPSRIALMNNSDDACIRCYELDPPFMNFDIKQNDSSQHLAHALTYIRISRMPTEIAINYLRLIKAPFTVRNPVKPSQAVVFQLAKGQGYLPTGVGDTTTSNNIVWDCIAYMIGQLLISGHAMSWDIVFKAAYYCGFQLTKQACGIRQEIQFLKHSPIIFDDGSLMMMPNPAQMLKYSGEVKIGDIELPTYAKNWSPYDKFTMYQSLLTYGFFKKFRYTPWMRLCPRFDELNYGNTEPFVELTRKEFYSHYPDLHHDEIEDFEALLAKHDVGFILQHTVVDKMMFRDYSYKW